MRVKVAKKASEEAQRARSKLQGGWGMARLFDFVSVVLLGEEGKPELQHVYPESARDETRGILHFCWPEGRAALDEAHAVATRSENFSFVLTESDGSKRFGYCRRFLRSAPPECVCAVSKVS